MNRDHQAQHVTKEKKSNGNVFTRSIKSQIMFMCLLLIIVTGGVIAFVSFSASVDNTTRELSRNVEKQMESFNETFEMFFENIGYTLDRFSSNDIFTDYKSKDRTSLENYLGETQRANDALLNIYTVFDKDGEIVVYPKADLGDFDARGRDWYKNALEARDEIVWSDPYIDQITDEMVITGAKALYQGDQLVGVVATDVLIDELMALVEHVEIGKTGYGVIYDNSGKYVVHPNKSLIGEDVSQEDYYKEMEKVGDSGIVEYKQDGEAKIIGYTTNTTTDWKIGGTVNVADFKTQAQKVFIPIAITVVIVIILSVVFSLLVANSITRPIQRVMKRMDSIASGDLGHEPLDPSSNREIGQLISATNRMNKNMQDMLHQITTVSETVTIQSESLTQSANEVSSGSEQIAMTMEDLAVGSETQANSVNDIATLMATFTQKVETSNENGQEIQHSSEAVVDMTVNGRELMDSSTEQMARIYNIVKDAVRKMQVLDKHSQEISKLVLVIRDIADQTNLLALNAAIEAARAGEEGAGFAVVADEVRKLAEQVASSVNDITQIVTNIQTESSAVADSLQDGYEAVEQGTVQIKTTAETFEEINSAMNEMAERIRTVSNNLSEITESSEEMNESIERIASVSEESAAGVEETAAGAEEASGSMEEVTASSEQLVRLAEELNKLVRRFNL